MTIKFEKLKKSVRLPSEIRYITSREWFTVDDLMIMYHISRRTVNRDLHDIKALGIKLVAHPSEPYTYTVVRSGELATIQLSEDELTAIFAMFLATKNSPLPYAKSRQNLIKNLLATVSEEQRAMLLRLPNLLGFSDMAIVTPGVFEATHNETTMLAPLLDAVALGQQFVSIDYRKVDEPKGESHEVYVKKIYNRHDFWYLDTWDRTRQANRTFRVDRIQRVVPLKLSMAPELLVPPTVLETERRQVANVKLKLNTLAIRRFQEFHQSTDALTYLDADRQMARYVTRVNLFEVDRLSRFADWVLYLGDGVTVEVMPAKLRQLLQRKGHRFDDDS